MNVEAFDLRTSHSAALARPVHRKPSRAQLRIRLYLSLIALDLLCIFASQFLAMLIYPRAAAEQWPIVASFLAMLYLCFALNGRAYASEVIVRYGLGIRRAMQSLALAAGSALIIAFYLKSSADFSRGAVGIGLVLSFLSIALVRWAFLARALRLVGGNPYSVGLIIDGNQAALDRTPFSFIIHASDDLDPDQDCPVMFNRLANALRDVDRVVITCPPERRLSWVRMLKGANIRSELIAPELVEMAPLALDSCGGMPTMVVADGPLGKFDAAVKRVFDFLLSGAAFLLLLPLMLTVALLIKATSPGPVFFVQTRIGQGNRMFRMFKFRSMQVEQGDTAGTRSAQREDDRVTAFGRFIRKTSIDELPQLINVLRGDMSIVGPRPHALGSRAEDRLFWEVDNRYWHRHAAKPGLTGLAQVRGFRGATERMSDLSDRLQADLEYLHNWSLWRDVLIVCQTFRVLIHRNAY